MKISCRWLRELLPLAQSPEDLAATLTALGHAVDAVSACGDDHVLDVDITSNRPDCLSVVGLARELAGYYRLPLSPPPTEVLEEGAWIGSITTVVVESPDLCPRYCARVLTSVKVAESPEWLKARLEAAGQRPINNVVDVTNLVMLEMGHPVHAFDLDRLDGHMIRVRRARAGERMKTLDGVERALDSETLVIADQKSAVAVAGVMGGEFSEIGPHTQRMLLESALFEPTSVRRTSKRLGLRTEASTRFEKGCDPEAPPRAADRVCRLLQEMGCVVARGYLDVRAAMPAKPAVELAEAQVSGLLGVAVPIEECAEMLRRLHFDVLVTGPSALRARPPSYRVDVDSSVDLVEEVARLYGYNRIPAALPPLESEPEQLLPHLELEEAVRDCLAGAGLTEVITYSFVEAPAPASGMIPLRNPISERTHLRDSLLYGLRECALHDINNGIDDFGLFEIGHVFHDGLRESSSLGILISTAPRADAGWSTPASPVGFHHLKGVVEGLFDAIGLEGVAFRAAADGLAEVRHGDRLLGRCGSVGVGAKNQAFFTELDLEELGKGPLVPVDYRPIARFPASTRDISLLVDESVEYASVAAAIEKSAGPELVAVQLIDLFRGEKVPAGKKSMTVRLRFQSSARTLASLEVEALCARCVEALERVGAVRR
ncbi:MAG: phenylalanine--tRNA ligase subunit beta [Acidobacteriota bacterium]